MGQKVKHKKWALSLMMTTNIFLYIDVKRQRSEISCINSTNIVGFVIYSILKIFVFLYIVGKLLYQNAKGYYEHENFFIPIICIKRIICILFCIFLLYRFTLLYQSGYLYKYFLV